MPARVDRGSQEVTDVAFVDGPATAIDLEVAAQRWSMEPPAFQVSVRALRERLGRPATEAGG